MQKNKNEKGITLIMLVITVVVLGLLSIPTVYKVQDIIKVDTLAKYKDDLTVLAETVSQVYSQDEDLSQIGPKYTGSITMTDKNPNDDANYYIIDVTKLNSDLNRKVGITMRELNYGESNYNVSQNGSGVTKDTYIINGQSRTIYYLNGFYNSNGETIYRYPGDFTSIEIDTMKKIYFEDGTSSKINMTERNLVSYYGKIVSNSWFSSNEENQWKWQLFYDDDKYVFLIANDYIPNSKAPANGNPGYGTTDLMKVNGSDYNVSFCSNDSFNDYVMTSSEHIGSNSSAIKNNPLTKKYLKWVSSYPNSENNNMKATAFMMDTNKWSSFAGNTFEGTFAIGGPTLELFIESFNAKHSSQIATYTTITGDNANSNGYKVKWENDASWSDNLNNIDTSSNNMWCISSDSKSNTYFLASPTNSTAGAIRTYTIWKNIQSAFLYRQIGLRPLVCIPKESIGL